MSESKDYRGYRMYVLVKEEYPPSVAINSGVHAGIAHYNSKTGKYTQDSLIIVDDSTIRIRRDAR